MKHERWIGGLWAWLLAFCAAFSGAGCLQSGLGLKSDMAALAVVFAVGALVAALCCVFRLYLVPLGGMLVLCAVFWRQIMDSARYLVERACVFYDMAYGSGVPIWDVPVPETASEEPVLILLGGCMICMVTAAMLSGRGLSASALMAMLPLIPCVVVTDTVPESGFLFFLLLSVLLLIMTNGVRLQSLRKANVLLLWLTVPAVLGLLLLFGAVDRENYNGREGAQKLEDFVVSLFEGRTELPKLPQNTVPVQAEQKEQVDLRSVGYNPRLGLRVMSVKAETTGRMYLRGAMYDVYTGTGWDASGSEISASMDALCQSRTRYVTVQTAQVQNVLYVPYVTTQLSERLEKGQLPNTQLRKEYTLAYREPIPEDGRAEVGQYLLSGAFTQTFLQLPQATRNWAHEYLPETVGDLTAQGRYRAAAEAIGQLVKSSAEYDRMTKAMPIGETDFAKWFMESGETGYCVHFATAATVLLRAAGIPARYVTGYLAQTEAGIYSPVTTDEAHAWVEYYLPDGGWTVLEVTPADTESPVGTEGTEPEEPSAGTQPSGTEPSGETTVPTTEGAEPEETVIGTRPSPSESTEGTGGTEATAPDAETPARSVPEWVKTAMTVALSLAGVLAVTVGQWQLRLWLRRQRRQRGRANARALTRWRDAAQMAKLLKREPSETLRQLALKARFSQYTLTEQELGLFDRELAAMVGALRKKAWYLQLIYRVVLALY